MKLEVPLIRQPPESLDCGIAGLAMIYAYYNKGKNFEDLKKEIEIHKGIGTFAPQLGSYLIKDGFKVKITTYHPGLVCKNFKDMKQNELYQELIKLKDNDSERNKKTIQYFLDFINNGGEIEIKISSKEDLLEEIRNKRPVGVLMTTGLLYGNKPLFNFHFVIATGIEGGKVIINDPLPDERGGKKEYKLDEFFYGVYASAYGDLDNASFIKIRN